MHKLTADPTHDEARVRSAVAWNRRWGESFAGLYYDDELAGPDGTSIQLLVTEDTPDEQIQQAEQEAQDSQDVVALLALVVPAEWLTDNKEH